MRNASVVIGEMLEAIRLAREGCRDRSLPDFETSGLVRLGVERSLEIISEAARHLPADLVARHPDIPWQKIRGIGNVLRHEYYRIAPDIIWAVVHHELPVLEVVLASEASAYGEAPWDNEV